MTTNSSKAPAPASKANPADFAKNMLRLSLESGRVLSNLIECADEAAKSGSTFQQGSDAAEMMGELFSAWMSNPTAHFQAQADLIVSYADLWSGTMHRFLGEDAKPAVEPEPGDTRFKDSEWSSNPFFDFWKQAYLLNTRFCENVLDRTDGLAPETRDRLALQLRLVTGALSPSNFPATNPAAVRETLATNGKNLIQGMRNLVADMEKDGDVFTITQTDTRAFEIGRNLAVTPGKVVFQNDIFQLIQYAPATDKVREVPLLIVPPWINKYYILDLTPEKSFVKFSVEQGFTVFMVSWINPDARHASKTFENYLTDGLLSAANAVTRETGAKKGNVLGYCIGGTLVGSALAYLAARDEDRFASATFLTTQFDFDRAGDLKLFTSSTQLGILEELMGARGYLDGSRLAALFSQMRPKDLIWPFVVNNYLLGKTPPAFDILYWNQDSTRMPAANHAFYLRKFYNENLFAKGELVLEAPSLSDNTPECSEDHILAYLKTLRGRNEPEDEEAAERSVRLDLSKVRLPVYELATKEDHIAPAVSVYTGAKLLGGPVEFVLAGSGHIAGVINPPGKKKYQYWTAPDALPGTIEDWSGRTKEHPGSWWPHWAEWLSKHSGGWTGPRAPGAKLGVIEDAPGSYVRG